MSDYALRADPTYVTEEKGITAPYPGTLTNTGLDYTEPRINQRENAVKKLALLLLAPTLFACSDNGTSSTPAMLGYQDCRAKMRRHFQEQGLHPAAADMKSKSTCEAEFKDQ